MQYDVSAIVNDASAPCHRYLRGNELRMQRCTQCGFVRYPARPVCPECLSDAAEWRQLSGKGVVEAFVWYLNDAYDEAYDSAWAWREVPYNVALVRIEGGPTIVTNVIGTDFETLKPEQKVEAMFVPISKEYAMLRFKPEGAVVAGEMPNQPPSAGASPEAISI